MTLTDTLKGIALANDLPRLEGMLKDMTAVCARLGWASGWSRVKDDPAAAPIYQWLSECQAMQHGLTDPLAIQPEITRMARRCVALFGDTDNPELVEPLESIRRGLGGALC